MYLTSVAKIQYSHVVMLFVRVHDMFELKFSKFTQKNQPVNKLCTVSITFFVCLCQQESLMASFCVMNIAVSAKQYTKYTKKSCRTNCSHRGRGCKTKNNYIYGSAE
jgi:hypothetical protein